MNCLPPGYTCGDNDEILGITTGSGYDVVSMFAPMIMIRWASCDLPFLETHPLTPGRTIAGAPTRTGNVGGSKVTGTSTSLSGSAITGIVVGSIIGMFILAVVIVQIWQKRRHGKGIDMLYSTPELDGLPVKKHELGTETSSPTELPTDGLASIFELLDL
jgi:hypothetical protein